jgi:general secretion pathway protein J
MNRRAAAGFTLVEILVAMFIFAIVGVMAMGGYNQLTKQRDIMESSASRTRAVQSAIQRMTQDFAMVEPRPVRDPLGQTLEPALRAERGGQQLVSLTHSGWSNPAGVPRSTLQRVEYRLEDGKLRRDYWVVLDRTLNAEPQSTVLVDKVKSVSLRYMDQNLGWHEQWPPLGASGPAVARMLPIGVEITVEFEDWGKIVRLVEVAG